MIALQQRGEEGGIRVHQLIGPRIYEQGMHGERINKAREYVSRCLDLSDKRIVELGCGTGDIIGVFSDKHRCHGYDCNEGALGVAKERFPNLYTYSKIEQPTKCDVLILCEFLEHISEPIKLVESWLPLANQVVISHPINGDLNGDFSGGEHQWSYSDEDFEAWFRHGGHELLESDKVQLGQYLVRIGRGKRHAA